MEEAATVMSDGQVRVGGLGKKEFAASGKEKSGGAVLTQSRQRKREGVVKARQGSGLVQSG